MRLMVFASSFKGATGPGEPCSPQRNPKEQKCQIQSSTRKHLSLVTASRSICKAVDLLFTYSPQLPPSTYCSCHGQQQDTLAINNWQLVDATAARVDQHTLTTSKQSTASAGKFRRTRTFTRHLLCGFESNKPKPRQKHLRESASRAARSRDEP